jgi:hypothetical protein
MDRLRGYAAQKGCDAIIFNGPDDTTVGGGYLGHRTYWNDTATLKGYRMTCIVYTGSDAPHAKPAADPVKSTCDEAYFQVGALAGAWAEWRSGRAQDHLPSQTEFAAVCKDLSEQTRACLWATFLRTHHVDCDKWSATPQGSALGRLNDMLVMSDHL